MHRTLLLHHSESSFKDGSNCILGKECHGGTQFECDPDVASSKRPWGRWLGVAVDAVATWGSPVDTRFWVSVLIHLRCVIVS